MRGAVWWVRGGNDFDWDGGLGYGSGDKNLRPRNLFWSNEPFASSSRNDAPTIWRPETPEGALRPGRRYVILYENSFTTVPNIYVAPFHFG